MMKKGNKIISMMVVEKKSKRLFPAIYSNKTGKFSVKTSLTTAVVYGNNSFHKNYEIVY